MPIQRNTSATLSMLTSLEAAIEYRAWTHGSLLVCSDDFGWNETSRMLSTYPTIGLAHVAVIIQSSDQELPNIDFNRRILFFNASSGVLKEVYTTNGVVEEELGSLDGNGTVLKPKPALKMIYE